MNEPLSLRLMALHPDARPGFTMPHSPPQRGDEALPAREHETGILWRYVGPVPATPTSCALYPWEWLPDLDDAGSWGPLLKCAQKVHQAPRLGVHWFEGDDDHPSPFSDPGWIVDLGDGENVVCGADEYEEALVCAIEDAAGVDRA